MYRASLRRKGRTIMWILAIKLHKSRKHKRGNIFSICIASILIFSSFSGCILEGKTTIGISQPQKDLDQNPIQDTNEQDKSKTDSSLNDVLNCTSERNDKSPAIYVSDFFSALAATPIAMFYDKEGKQHKTPLVFEGAHKKYMEEFLGKYEKYELSPDNIEESSAKAALEFWKKSDAIMVIENSFNGYLLGVSAAAIASYLNIPIVFGTSNLEKIIESLNPKFAIEIGNVNTSIQSIKLKSEKDVQTLETNIAQRKFRSIEYFTLANPKDIDCTWGSQGLSCMASYLTAYRKGVVCVVDLEPLPEKYFGCEVAPEKGSVNREDANLRAMEARQSLLDLISEVNSSSDKTFSLKNSHLCILGDSYTIPFYYYFWDGDTSTEVEVCTDDIYADLDCEKYTVELAAGRIMGKSCGSVSDLIIRTLFYPEIISSIKKKSLSGEDEAWMDNAFVHYGDDWNGAILASSPYYLNSLNLFYNNKFNVKTAAVASGKTISEDILHYYTSSNFIYVMAHGYPEGYQTVDKYTSAEIENWDMGLSTVIMMACSVGRTDWDNFKSTLTIAFIESGAVSYVGGSRDESVTQSPTINEYLLQNLVEMNETVGFAARDAKNTWVNLGNDRYYRVGHSAIKILYGDPAFNPYEPCNEGTSEWI